MRPCADQEAEHYGICRIVPPPSWSNTFQLDLNSLKFHTRVQKVHELQKKPLKPPEPNRFKSELEVSLSIP